MREPGGRVKTTSTRRLIYKHNGDYQSYLDDVTNEFPSTSHSRLHNRLRSDGPIRAQAVVTGVNQATQLLFLHHWCDMKAIVYRPGMYLRDYLPYVALVESRCQGRTPIPLDPATIFESES